MRLVFLNVLTIVCFNYGQGQILYECTSATKDTTTYLLGTCHVLPSEQFKNDPKIDSLIRISNVVFSELYIKVSDVNKSEYISEIRKLNYFENGGRLDDFISKKEVDFIYSFYKENFNLTKRRYHDMRYYLPLVMHRRIVYSEDKYVKMDKLLYAKASDYNKPIILLDNENLLINAHNELNRIYNLEWLISILHNFDNEKLEKKTLFNAFLNQDTTLLKEWIKRDPASQNKLIIKERNNYWVKVINGMSSNINFVFAGIAHVIGDYGLLEYYKSKGYEIKPIALAISKN